MHPENNGHYGTFVNSVFDNGRIKYEIHGLNAEIQTHFGRMLVENVHPEVWINENGWEKVKYKMLKFFNYTSNGAHRVVVEAEHKGKIYSHLTIVYDEKTKFSLYQPLFPKLFITFNKTIKYKINMVLENVKINHFLVIDNGTGYTEPPFKKGHMRYMVYNGTIKSDKRFRAWQDIVIGFCGGKKKFGLNWEKYKGGYRNLKFEKGDSGISMEVESDPQEMSAYTVKTVGFPIPDTGGGGSGGGGSSPKDTDGDGLSDDKEEAGWYAYWYDSSGNYHWALVTSDKNKKDTDGDGASDMEEYQQQTDPRSWDTDGDGMSDGYEIHHGKPAGGWQEPNWYNHRYAVIVVGGGYLVYYDNTNSLRMYPAFWNDGKAMYYKLVNDYHYTKNDVYLLSSAWYCRYPNSDRGDWFGHNMWTDEIVDGEAMWDSPTHYDIKNALDDISSKITVHDSLMIVVIAHGGYKTSSSGFFLVRADISDSDAIRNPSNQIYEVDSDTFGAYLNSHFGGNNGGRKYAVMTIILQTCNSESMVPNLEGDHRIVMAASDWDKETYIEMGSNFQHFAFIYEGSTQIDGVTTSTYPGIIESMGSLSFPHSLYYMYSDSCTSTSHNYGAVSIVISGIILTQIVADGRSTPHIYNMDLAEVVYL